MISKSLKYALVCLLLTFKKTIGNLIVPTIIFFSNSSTWNAHRCTRTFQSMVFKESLLFCIDICRFAIAIRVCTGLRADYVCYDCSTARNIPFEFILYHFCDGNIDIARIRYDHWCHMWSEGKFDRFHSHNFCQLIESLFSIPAGCNHWSVCDCPVCGIFWIFLTFSGCTFLFKVDVPYIIPEIWAGRELSCAIRLQSTKAGMQWYLLPLSNTNEIYGNCRYASQWLHVCIHHTFHYLYCFKNFCFFPYGLAPTA